METIVKLSKEAHIVRKCYEIRDEIANNLYIKSIEIEREKIYFNFIVNNYPIRICDEPFMGQAGVVTLTDKILTIGEYENDVERVLFRLARMSCQGEGNVIIDIGAHIGFYSILLKKMLPDQQICSIEANRLTYQSLCKNLEGNDLSIEDAYNFAFSANNGKGKLYFDKTVLGASSMVDLEVTGAKASDTIECEMLTLDSFVDIYQIKRLNLIKCDVEGAELLVFEGGLNSLKKFRPIVLTEMLRRWSAKFNYHPNDIIKLFGSIDYCCYSLSGECILKITEVTEETTATNFIFLPLEKEEMIRGVLGETNA